MSEEKTPEAQDRFDPSGLDFTHFRVLLNGVTLPDTEQLVYGDVVSMVYLVESTEAKNGYLAELAARIADGNHPLFEAGEMVGGRFEPLTPGRERDENAEKARKREPQVFE